MTTTDHSTHLCCGKETVGVGISACNSSIGTGCTEFCCCCCVCYDKLEVSSSSNGRAPDVQLFVSNVLNEIAGFADEAEKSRQKNDPLVTVPRFAVPVCSRDGERHVLCNKCAQEFVKHSTNSQCPMCKSDLTPVLRMCQQHWSMHKKSEYLQTRQERTRQLIQLKIQQLRDSFASRFEQQYYVRENPPKASRFKVQVSTTVSPTNTPLAMRGDTTVSWHRQEDGRRLDTTLSGVIRAHETLETDEWKRLVEHTMGITIDSWGALNRSAFITQCNELADEIPFLTRWPRDNLDDERLLDAASAFTLESLDEAGGVSSGGVVRPLASNTTATGSLRPTLVAETRGPLAASEGVQQQQRRDRNTRQSTTGIATEQQQQQQQQQQHRQQYQQFNHLVADNTAPVASAAISTTTASMSSTSFAAPQPPASRSWRTSTTTRR